MPAINDLNEVTQLSGSDLVAVYDQSSGCARKSSLDTLLDWMESQEIATQDNKITQYAAPTAGSTLLVTDSQNSVWLILTPAATIATLTLKFPVSSNVLDRTEILMNTTNTITALTLDGNGASIVGAITTLTANSYARYRFDIVMQTWYRVG